MRGRLGRVAGLALLTVAIALTMALALPGGRAGASSASPSPGGSSAAPGTTTLRIGWTSEPDNLNPFVGYANVSYEIWAMNYSFLFGFGAHGQPSLDLATELPTKENGGISPDGRVWTVHIRSNVKWQDGLPLTADDVAFTYNYIIRNQMAMMAVATVGIKEVSVVDPLTVKIVCSQPKADLEHVFIPILPKHIWENVSPKAAQSSYQNKPPVIGSGPFQVVDFKKGAYVRLVANKGYYGGAPHVDQIIVSLYYNPEAMVEDLKADRIDAAWGIPQAQFAGVKATSGIDAVQYVFFNWNYLNFNCYDQPGSLGNAVLRDARFRHALNYAVNRQQLAQVAFYGYAQPGTTILPPGNWSNPDYHWQPPAGVDYTFDLAKANQLLDAAGYQRGPDGTRLYKGRPIVLRLWSTTDNPPSQTEAKLVADWLSQVGLKVKLASMEYAALEAHLWNFKGDTYAPDFDMYVSDWAGYGDPGQTLSSFTTAQIGYMNETCWSNARYDKLNQVQATTLDTQARKADIDRMQQVMYEDTPWVVLTYPSNLEAYNTTRWTGWVRIQNGQGPAFMTTGNMDSYLNVQPVSAATTGGSKTGAVVAAVAGAAAIVIVVFLLLRRRPRQVEEVA